MIFIWAKAREPDIVSIKLELFYGFWVFFFEVGWTFYGNFVVYNDTLNSSCAELTYYGLSVEALWWSAIVIIVYGYLLMLMLLGIVIVAIGMFYVKKAWD